MGNSALIGDVHTGSVIPFGNQKIHQTGSRLADAGSLLRDIRDLQPRSERLRRNALVDHWEELLRSAVTRDGRELLAKLSEAGMAWRDVARVTKVSVPAVQKWRRGDGITGANRQKLAGIVAVLDFLKENMISDPVSWLEVPIKPGVSVTPLDMLAAGRVELVLEYGHDEHATVETAVSVLDEFDQNWRETRVDNAFEIFTAEDGVPSIRPRGESNS